MSYQWEDGYDGSYTAREDRLMRDRDLQTTDTLSAFEADESSHFRTTGRYRPMEGNSGSFGQSGFYRPPVFNEKTDGHRGAQDRRYDDLQEESYSRIFASSASVDHDGTLEDRWGLYDFKTPDQPLMPDLETSYFSDYFTVPKPMAEPLPEDETMPKETHADTGDDSFLHAYDDVKYDVRQDGEDNLRYDVPEDLWEELPKKRQRRFGDGVKKNGKKRWIVLISVLAAAAAVGLGVFLVDRLVSPMMNFEMDDVVQQEDAEISPDSIPSAQAMLETEPIAEEGEKPESTPDAVQNTVQQQFTIPAWSVYLVQAGAFRDPNNADNYAQSMRVSGGAGYVIDNEYYRVMTTAFNNEYDAGQMRDALMAQSASAQVYELSFSQMDFTVSAGEDDVDVLTSALAQWPELIKSLMTVIRRMDAEEITSQEAVVSVKEVFALLETSKNALANVSGAHGSVLVRDLSNMYTEAARILADVLEGGSIQKGETLARVKYAHIGMCWNYRALVEGIAQDTAPVPSQETQADETAQ